MAQAVNGKFFAKGASFNAGFPECCGLDRLMLKCGWSVALFMQLNQHKLRLTLI
jgi:hypothetical protein